MKRTTKIVALFALALFLLMTGCTRSVSTAPVASPTPIGEAPFPFTTPDPMSTIKTQTAVALTPVVLATATPEVIVATVNPTDAQAETGGGQATQPPAQAAESSGSSGGTSAEIPGITRPASYTLQKGEWPICIARRFDLDISTFFAQNGLNMNSKPGVGKVLTIPSSGTWSSSYGNRTLTAHPATYTVVSGDSVYTIACRYGDVSPEQILAANGLANASDITPGKTLNIP
jgi:LysM repeat protein